MARCAKIGAVLFVLVLCTGSRSVFVEAGNPNASQTRLESDDSFDLTPSNKTPNSSSIRGSGIGSLSTEVASSLRVGSGTAIHSETTSQTAECSTQCGNLLALVDKFTETRPPPGKNRSNEPHRKFLHGIMSFLVRVWHRHLHASPEDEDLHLSNSTNVILGGWCQTLKAAKGMVANFKRCKWINPVRQLSFENQFDSGKKDSAISGPEIVDKIAQAGHHVSSQWPTLTHIVKLMSEDFSLLANNQTKMSSCARSLLRSNGKANLKSSTMKKASQLVSGMVELLDFFVDVIGMSNLLGGLEIRSKPLTEAAGLPFVGPLSWQNDQLFELMNITFEGVVRSMDSKQSCQHMRLCDQMRRAMSFLNGVPSVRTERRNRLAQVVGVTCWTDSTMSNHSKGQQHPNSATTSHRKQKDSRSCRGETCSRLLACPDRYFINISRNHKLSFSPELLNMAFINDSLGAEYINASKNISFGLCSISCEVRVPPGSSFKNAQTAFHFIGMAGNMIFLAIVSYASWLLVSSKENRKKMFRSARRTYLYLNIHAVFSCLVHDLPAFLPKEGFWCNGDGSLVIGPEMASSQCRALAGLLISNDIIKFMVYFWVTAVWWRTLKELNKAYCIREKIVLWHMTKMQVVESLFNFCLVAVTVIVTISAIYSNSLVSGLEGEPRTRLCVPAGFFNSHAILAFQIFFLAVFAFTFLHHRRTFGNLILMRRGMRRERFAGNVESKEKSLVETLKKWQTRHSYFFILIFCEAAVLLVEWLDALISTGVHIKTSQSSFERYVKCAASNACQDSCQIHHLHLHVAVMDKITSVLFLSLSIAGFRWILFDEIQQPRRLKRLFKKYSSSRLHLSIPLLTRQRSV